MVNWQKPMWLLTNYFCLFPMIASSFAKDALPSGFAAAFPKFGDLDARMIGKRLTPVVVGGLRSRSNLR